MGHSVQTPQYVQWDLQGTGDVASLCVMLRSFDGALVGASQPSGKMEAAILFSFK